MKTFALILLLLMCHGVVLAQDSGPRYELGVLGTYTFLKEIGSRDSGPGTEAAGIGGRFVYRAGRFLDLETDVIVLPGNAATSGHRLEALLGAKTGLRFERFGLFLKARPGFIHFWRDPFGVGKPGASFLSHERARSTEPVMDLGGVIEYYTVRGLIVRFDLGDTRIRYAPRVVRTSDFVPPFSAGGFSTHNWQGSFGVGFRF